VGNSGSRLGGPLPSRAYGARWEQPTARGGKQIGGIAIDETDHSTPLTDLNMEQSARMSGGLSLVHPRSSALFWLVALAGWLIWTNGRDRTRKKGK
jgi:hypothetical protein